MQLFSALLVFELRLAAEPVDFPQILESLVIFEAEDWGPALVKAREIGQRRAPAETSYAKNGSVLVTLIFHGVATLDIAQDTIDSKEVWARLSDFSPEVVQRDWSKVPPQTI